MTDKLERVISKAGNFFGVACNTTDLVQEACRRHDVGPLGAVALGRALTGAALLAALMKDNQSVMLRFEGSGPVQKIITEAGYNGWVRGYIGNPHAQNEKGKEILDVAAGIGKAGFLTVTKTIEPGKKYPGTIQLYTSEIGDDLAYYLSQSEQTPSTIALATQLEPDGRIRAAGGFLIQSLPPADDELLSNIESEIKQMEPLSSLLLSGTEPGQILSNLFAGVPHKKIGSRELTYSCSCSHEKMESAVMSLPLSDLDELSEKQDGVSVRCEFCRMDYQFSKEHLNQLVERRKGQHN